MADWRQNTLTGIGDPVSAYYYYSNLQCHVEYHMYAVVPYMHGLASGDFELALSGLLGEQAPLSASTVARAKERWQAEYSEWQQRPIEDEIGYLWLDGVYLKAGLEQEKAALLVAIGVKADGHKVVLAVTSGYRESTASWSGLLRDLKARGMHEPRLLVGDGNLGLWSALRNIFPGAEEQRCWNHRVVNLLTQVPKQRQGEARELLTKIPYQASARQARQKQRVFQNWCLDHGYERAAALIDENWEQMVSFYRFPRAHCARATWSSRHSQRCACAPPRRSDSRRSPTRPLWYARCCCSPNASYGASTRPSYCRPSPPGSSITTAYRSEEANTRRPPPDLFTHRAFCRNSGALMRKSGRENKRTDLSLRYFVGYAVRTSVAPHSARIRSLMRRR